MNRRRRKEREEMSARVDGGGEEESLSAEGDSGWEGKDKAAAGANPVPHPGSSKGTPPSAGIAMKH